MLQQERLAHIVSLVREHRFCSVQQLARWANVSQATIRRDLLALSQNDQVRLTRGGAMSVPEGTFQEPAYEIKYNLHLDEKIRIGREACRHIRAGETLLLDTGTTVLQMAIAMNEQQNDWQNLTVATNDLRTACELSRIPSLSLHMLGGVVRKGHYTTMGCWTQTALDTLHADKGFLSCDAVDIASGLTITNVEEVAIKQSMLQAASERILLCDHAKFQAAAFMRLCSLERIQRIITGRELSEDIVAQFREAGIDMVLV